MINNKVRLTNANYNDKHLYSVTALHNFHVQHNSNRFVDRLFKILNGYENIDSNIFFFKIKESKLTRGHIGLTTRW